MVSAELKKVFVEMVRSRMVDAIVSTGANIVDQDFFEGLGFHHYIAEDYLKAGNEKRKLCGLYLTLMDRMGLTLPEFGDAKERLAGI